jgi:hypothetical protein
MSELAIPLEADQPQAEAGATRNQENQNFWIPPFDHTQDMLSRV